MSREALKVWSPAQYAEAVKYRSLYGDPEYRMGMDRASQALELLLEHPELRSSLLDVGCGRGEVLRMAETCGYANARGTEIVEALASDRVVWAQAWALPFAVGAFETVTCFDVLEHLLHDDQEAAVREIGRVAGQRIVLAIGMEKSGWGGHGDLHVGLRSEADWTARLAEWLPEWAVSRRPDRDTRGISSTWEALRS